MSVPPNAFAVFDVGSLAFDGTFTGMLITGNELPPVTCCVLVQVTVLVPLQLQLVPVGVADVVNPVGSTSTMVVVPCVIVPAAALLLTVTCHTAFVLLP